MGLAGKVSEHKSISLFSGICGLELGLAAPRP